MQKPTVRETFTCYGKTFDHKADAERWSEAVAKALESEAYRFLAVPKREGEERTFEVDYDTSQGALLKFKDGSGVRLGFKSISAFAPAWHQRTLDSGEVREYQFVHFLSQGLEVSFQ